MLGEEGPTCRSVTGNDIPDLIAPAVSRLVNTLVQEFRYIVELFLRKALKCRHAFIGAAIVNDGADQFALFVVEDDRRANQVRTFRAVCVCSMAERTIY